VQNVATRSDVQVLAPDLAEFAGVTFSPDGNTIYFVRSENPLSTYRYLYQMPVLGGSARQLIRDIDAAIDFSPDGKQNRFSARHSRNASRWKFALRKPTERRTTPCSSARQFIFSIRAHLVPDGRTVAISALGVGKETNWG